MIIEKIKPKKIPLMVIISKGKTNLFHRQISYQIPYSTKIDPPKREMQQLLQLQNKTSIIKNNIL